MKRLSAPVKKGLNKLAVLMTMLLLSFYGFAQDKKVDVNINTKPDDGSSFFMQPWVWVVGGAVFLLLLVALLRNNSSSKT
jgi:cell division protein FtsW (lipid II flippase)